MQQRRLPLHLAWGPVALGLLMLSIVPTRNFDDYYLFGPPRPHAGPWRGRGELSLHLLSASPAAGRPVRAGTTSGEGGINNNKNNNHNKKLRGVWSAECSVSRVGVACLQMSLCTVHTVLSGSRFCCC